MLTNFKVLAFLTAVASLGAGCILIDADSDDNDDGFGGFNDGGFGAEGGFGAGTENSNGGSGAGSTCADDFSGTPDDCFTSCEKLSNCNGIGNFKDGVAEILVDCLNTLNPATCSFELDVLDVCTVDALSAACFDDSSASYCSDIALACDLPDDEAFQDECGAYVDGLSSTGKDTFTNCQVDACVNGDGVDLYACLYLLYP